ncbi:MAG: dihydroxyacid dehydratase/phosphogluconate dehydratase [uncultured Candidatus Thioglobus sp.]|nr:MAG: dihydroxyacid dehydratase/phosphogluconate dehydratase [uncultured Candidatus Thioglobus sp.]
MCNTRKYSSQVVDGYERAPSRAMLYPVGFEKEDFNKPQVGIASTWSMVTPCNMHIDKLADEAEKGVNSAGGKVVYLIQLPFQTVISMGSEGMKYSLGSS